MKIIKCDYKGCGNSNANVSIFTVGKGHFCAQHFTGERAKTESKKPKEAKPNA